MPGGFSSALPSGGHHPTRFLEPFAGRGVRDHEAARLACLLGHAYLAMDYHEFANAAYRDALAIDASVRIPWENPAPLEYVRRETFGP